MDQPTIGVRSIATYLPEERLSAEEISIESGIPSEIVREKLGIESIAVAGEKDHPVAMGVWAAKKALQRAKLSPSQLDLIIYVGEEYKEYPLWTAATNIQQELGATNAWGFDVSMRCGTSVMAMKLAKSLLQTDDRIKTVLLTGGYRNGDLIDYKNPRTRFMFNLASGGGACILQKGWEKNTVLETEVVTDGRFSKDVLVKEGGTLYPFSNDNNTRDHSQEKQRKRIMTLDVTDPEGMKKRLEEVSLKNFLSVIRSSLEKSGYQEEELDYLAILHMKRSAHRYVLKELNLSEEQTLYLSDIGHVGQFDQWISVERALNQGLIKEESIVTLVSAGIGYAWAATTIRWG
ncbi:3-oxoacyl-ACP synthase [Evansella sp. AB-P1]|uniref:3-oxoacyl-ACP synthase n=1 Tax=Evansella sp. AB-P1 TaxID=3037653 RepID=UPI0024204D84|nr:3-oxoacyl-ACP synthase [Evansella sp. AB-P1]MDG5787435.1 3-oxoacyl-ACP synthase [Evansella sp. AB-P1]